MTEKSLFSSLNRFEAGMFMIAWKAKEPTLPVKIEQNGDLWQVIRND